VSTGVAVSRKKSDLSSLEGVGPKTLEKLQELGVVSVEHLAEFTVEELVEAGIEYDRAVKILPTSPATGGGRAAGDA
jgi:DNA repair protein RadA